MTRASNAEPATPEKCNLIGYNNTGSSSAESLVGDHLTCNLLGYKTARLLWLWVGAGFLLLTLAWVAVFTAARHADTRTVPLQTAPVRR